MEESSEKDKAHGGSMEWQARDWGQGDLQEKYEVRRGREVRMSTYHLRVLAGRRGAILNHPSDSVNSDTFDDGGSDQGRRAAPL